MKRTVITYELIMFLLALVSLVVIWTDNQTFLMLDRFVLAIFIVDVSIRIMRADKKWEYVRKNPFDIVAIIPLDAIFQLARFARLFRVLRMFLIGKKFARPFFLILKTNGLDKLIGVTAGLIFLSSIPIHFYETSVDTYQDAIWWSVVTTTTVGYGDISPETGIGRAVAVVLMFVGIGLIGMTTGAIATFFIKGEEEISPTIIYLKEQVSRIDHLSPSEIENIIVILERYKKDQHRTWAKKESV
ncbi:potassium channel family protein [Alteribacter aurantiacus]|uniref:potassium channel family protein n=1 Tax=Alteribacter aurantiacus TaxID=254410 RepID=UPI00041879B6|nr:potassium channel family protein [Alteribacter aurantiacus]